MMRMIRICMLIIGCIISGTIGILFMIFRDQEILVIDKHRMGVLLFIFSCIFMTEIYQRLKEY